MMKKVAQINTKHIRYDVFGSLSSLLGEDSAMELYDGVELAALMPDSEFIILIKDEANTDEPLNIDEKDEEVLTPIIKWAIAQGVSYIHFSHTHERVEELPYF